MSMKKIIENYKKELKNKLLLVPGDKIRKECTTYDCPMYILMVTLNNNCIGIVNDTISCPENMCKKIKKGVFKCSLSGDAASVFSGFFFDKEFFSYESFLSKDCLPVVKGVPSKRAKVSKYIETIVPEEEEEEEEVKEEKVIQEITKITAPPKGASLETIKEALIKHLDRYLGDEQTASYTRVKDKDTLVFTNPIETDLRRINKSITIDKDFCYEKTLAVLKEFYSGILNVKKQHSCEGCSELPAKNTGMSLGCSSCTRNEGIRLLTDIPKTDNFKSMG